MVDDGPPSNGWSVIATGLLIFLLLVALERALAMVFVLNFSIEGPGPSVLLVGLLASGLIYPVGLHRAWPHQPLHLDAALITTSTLVLFSLFPHPLFAALTSFLAVITATPLLFAAVAHLGNRFHEAAAFGLLVHQAGRAWLDTTPYAASSAGWMWVTVAALALFAVWILLVRDRITTAVHPPNMRLVFPVLLFGSAFVGSPIAVALWSGTALLPIWLVGIAGITLGLTVSRLPIAHHPFALVTAAFVAILAAFDVIARMQEPLLSYPLLLAALLLLLANDTGRPGPRDIRHNGTITAILQFVAVVAVFLFGVAPSWAFLGEPLGPLTHGRAPAFLMGLVLVIAGIALFAPPILRQRRLRPQIHPDDERGYALALTLAVLVAIGGLWVHEGPPGSAPDDGPALRIATYNVHQYFTEGQTGHYNLDRLAAVIEESGADIIALQESEGARITSGNLDGVRDLGHRLGMHTAHGPPASEQIYGVALLSQYPIRAERWIHLPNERSVERVALHVTLDSPYGFLPVVVTHLQTEAFPEDRIVQTERLLEWTAPLEKMVLLGDFNSPGTIEDPAYRRLAGNLTDAWVASGQDPATGPTSLDTVPKRIDHIWLKGEWQVAHCTRHHDAYASDHRLLACDLIPGTWPPIAG